MWRGWHLNRPVPQQDAKPAALLSGQCVQVLMGPSPNLGLLGSTPFCQPAWLLLRWGLACRRCLVAWRSEVCHHLGLSQISTGRLSLTWPAQRSLDEAFAVFLGVARGCISQAQGLRPGSVCAGDSAWQQKHSWAVRSLGCASSGNIQHPLAMQLKAVDGLSPETS